MRGDYFEEREYYLENIWFRYDGITYRGNGVLRWTPTDGFHIVAKIKGDSIPERKVFRSISFINPTRMRLEINSHIDKNIAITPFLRLDEMVLHFWDTFTVNFRRIVFFENLHESQMSEEEWFGSAMYEADPGLVFPDTIYKETKIGIGAPRQSFASTGFEHLGGNGEHIVGEIRDKKYLYFHWALPKQNWTKQQSWRFAEALQDALSIVSGKITRLRYHETHRNHRIAKEYNANGEPLSLGLIFRLFDDDIVNKNLVIHLALFLSQGGKKEKIIRKIIMQIVDASKQNSQQGKELLLSTILEAALRTLYEQPFVLGQRSIDLQKFLKRFQSEYLTGIHEEEWDAIILSLGETYRRLRHRNAHPDWLTTPMGMLSVPEKERTMNDMILLSRFYGYMILALSGIKELKPKFPAPISNWGPIMTMETNQTT